ncbi:MAG: hypothetical protein R3F04_16230 [Lysobacteraceae bacterium]
MSRLRFFSLCCGVLGIVAGPVSMPLSAQQASPDPSWLLAGAPSASVSTEGNANHSVIQRLLGAPLLDSRVVRHPATASMQADAVLQIDPQSNLALLCAQGFGIAGSLGRVGQRCLLGQLDTGDELPGYGQGVGISGAWMSDSRAIDLRFGLSWLDDMAQSPAPSLTAAHQLFNATVQEQSTPLSWDTLRIAGTTLQIGSVIEFGESGWFSVTGAQSWLETRNDALLQFPQRMNVEILQLDVGLGRLSAGIRGSQAQLGLERLKSVDVGVTWRTPWQGELSVGATQYWSRGDAGQWPLRELPVAEETNGRVPYVRYHQDL